MISDFTKGLITGVIFSALIFAFVGVVFYKNTHEKEVIKYVEIQQEIESLREDYSSRDPLEFVDSVPGVRGAADGATADFIRKRDEAIQRFRSRSID